MRKFLLENVAKVKESIKGDQELKEAYADLNGTD